MRGPLLTGGPWGNFLEAIYLTQKKNITILELEMKYLSSYHREISLDLDFYNDTKQK